MTIKHTKYDKEKWLSCFKNQKMLQSNGINNKKQGVNAVLSVAVVEDNENDASALLKALERYQSETGEVINFTRFKDAESFLTNYKPVFDVVFMDIMLGESGLNGMAAAKRMRQCDKDVTLIFVTTMAQFAINGYEVGAMDYFLKPIDYFKVKMRLDRVLRTAKRSGVYITAPVDGGTRRFYSDDIYYIEVITHTLYFHTPEGVFTARGVLKNVEKQLASAGFTRCGVSYLVNLNKIKNVKGNVLTIGDDELRITRGKQKEFLAKFTEFIKGESRR